MIACLRPLSALCLAGLLVACSSSPSSNLGELPRTPQASVEQMLQKAGTSQNEEAQLLRLSAADLAAKQGNAQRAESILGQVDLQLLKPAQQIYASTLKAELALARNDAKAALAALNHPSLERLGELPVEQQTRTQLARANALEKDSQILAAARERVFIAPLLSGDEAQRNQDHIWSLVSSLPAEPALTADDADLAGWLSLAQVAKTVGTLKQQQDAIDNWLAQHPNHPAAQQLPKSLADLRALSSKPLEKIALLLPQEGQLASVSRALRDGFLAAHYQAQQAGENPPQTQFYDSARLTSLDDFYRQAQADGVELVIGPLEKNLVTQLGNRDQLPITTLALNYADPSAKNPPQLFQFGLAAEDEAREVARRAWADGMRSAVALVPKGDWGNRVLDAFRQSWQAAGGTFLGAEQIDQPVDMASQVARLMQVNGTSRRQDVDFIFLAATPQQAQQIKPTLAYQYAGDVPVYATSHLFSGSMSAAQYRDLDGIRFCETPWLLDANDPLRQQVNSQWPQAGGSLGRLYAMGVDAFRLAPRLDQLKTLPDSRVEGLSGNLSLGASQRVERQLPWAQFSNGQVQRLPDANIE
ncbi:penicillin-binding protein activator [Pseudomonas sp. sia0905]|uniref:penicillin-binding protein activator n=1 Tax=Pseudomonas sp. sia0905 TaxID=2854783 RepID=UPI001C48EAFD|nr:penicillin-binding protein activator [Pseudomonas sp. sia0905]MBV7561600.1 penicillin-binding protein activator [Pseudomonas sp. sia0905]